MKNWYLVALEAIGTISNRNSIHNKLNTVAVYSDDPELRNLAQRVLDEFAATSVNSTHTSISMMKTSVPSGRRLDDYCKKLAYDPGKSGKE